MKRDAVGRVSYTAQHRAALLDAVSEPWGSMVTLIVAALGLVWWLLKKRK